MHQLKQETNELIKKLYFSLSELPDRNSVQSLEYNLSKCIYETEELIQSLKKAIADRDNQAIEELYRRRAILKRIADGLAWKIFNYDPTLIKAFSIGHTTGFMANKKGYMAERNLVAALYKFDKVEMAIQCDITNILLMGDVIATMQNGEIRPFEVKGTMDSRSRRQREKAQQIMDFANTGEYSKAMPGFAPLRSFKAQITYKHYWDKLVELSRISIKQGEMVFEILDDSVLFFVGLDLDEMRILQTLQQYNWTRDQCFSSRLSSHISRQKEILPKTSFPLTIFPIDPAICLEFLLGNIDAFIVLNHKVLMEQVKKSNLQIVQENSVFDILTETGIKFSIIDAWDRVLDELVTVPSFIEYLVASAQKIEQEYK